VPSGKAQKYRWEIPTLEGSEAVDEISGIIVFQKQTRAFWPQSIDDGGGNVPPSCSSPDAKFGFGKQWATREDPDPDGEPRRVACAQCPNAQFGSDGGRGQACKQTSQLFLLMETGFLPAVVQVPPTSLGAVKKYMLALANAGVRYDQVVTTLGWRRRPTRAAPSTRRSPRASAAASTRRPPSAPARTARRCARRSRPRRPRRSRRRTTLPAATARRPRPSPRRRS
jgi:hypothetical protein